MEDGAAASRGPALPPAAGIAALPGTRWVQVDAGARFRELHFTPTFLVLTTQAGQMVTLVADYSSSHPLCGGYPSCLMTVDGQANAVPFFFGQQDGVLFLAECRIAGQLDAEGNPLNFPALVEEHREALVYSSPRAVCWNPREVPFRMEPI